MTTYCDHGNQCECESSLCVSHADGPCEREASVEIDTMFGKYRLCPECDKAMPSEYRKAAC